MHISPLRTEALKRGCDLAAAIGLAAKMANTDLREGDILIVSSKVVALSEGRVFRLKDFSPSMKAQALARKLKTRSPEFCEAVLREISHRKGKLLGTCEGAALTEIHGILIANAGLDCSNAPPHHAIGWPSQPPESASRLRKKLKDFLSRAGNSTFHIPHSKKAPNTKSQNPKLAVIIIDSCCTPRRRGLSAVALACSGIDPFLDERGHLDLFSKQLHYTTDAVADCLASAASILMGNGAQGIPAVLIRDHGLQLENFTGWVEGIPEEEDLFRDVLISHQRLNLSPHTPPEV